VRPIYSSDQSRSGVLRMRNVSDGICRENQNTFVVVGNRAVCEIMWKNIVERGRPRVTVWRMRIACRVPKTTNTHSEYVILIACNERPSMLYFTLIACPMCYSSWHQKETNRVVEHGLYFCD
jgi:tRNA(Arg) A34 adenosine deaminase TadA